MNDWELTRVWNIDSHLVVGKTIEEAIGLYREYAKGAEIRSVAAVSASISHEYDAIIKKEKQ